jgi:hypothetical protein
MKRILALAFAATLITALVPTDVDARGGRGGGGGGMGGGGGGMGGGGIGGMGGGGNWAGGMGGGNWGGMGGNWAGGGGNWQGGNWRPGWRPGYGWGAAAIGAGAASAYPWGYDPYGSYAADDSCLQQRTVRRGGAYRTVWVNVC